MKRTLGSFFVTGCLLALPFGVSAATNKILDPSCTTDSSTGLKTCKITAVVDSARPATSLDFTLTEVGGADIRTITSADAFTVTQSESDGVWTVKANPISKPEWSGEGEVFSYTYMPSGTTDCLVKVSFEGVTYSDSTTTTTDVTTENKKTGSTLPYVAIGASLIMAASVYVSTKKKKKFYKI